jgi:hypothetical protein
MTIIFDPLTAMPAAPSRFATPTDYEDQWDAYLIAQNALVTEQNALIAAMNAQLVDATFLATTIYTLTATQASSVTSMADVTSMVAALEADATYKLDAYVSFKSAATTTGAAIGFSAPAGSNPMLQIDVPVNTSGSFVSRVFPNASAVLSGSAIGTGVTSITDVQTAKVVGLIKTTTAGNFSIQFASEVPGSAVTLQIGSTMTVVRIA